MAAGPGRWGRCGAGQRMGLRVVPRPGRGLGEEGAGAPLGLGSATACRFVTRHPAAPCRPNGHTGSSRWVRERNMRITNCPRVPYREGSRDLQCKCVTEINTGNTYPAGVQSKYTGPCSVLNRHGSTYYPVCAAASWDPQCVHKTNKCKKYSPHVHTK